MVFLLVTHLLICMLSFMMVVTTKSILVKLPLKVAASLALKNAAKKADPVILEPIMKVDIVVPQDNMGDVMGQVTARRGTIDGMEERGNAQLIHSFVPLSEMFGYATALRSATQGRGTFTDFRSLLSCS